MSKRRRETNQTAEPTLFAEDTAQGETRMMYSLPPRFHAVANVEGGFVTLTDTESRQSVKIVPAAFGEIRRVLGAFFGGHPEEETDFIPELDAMKSRADEQPEAAEVAAPAQESRAAAAAEATPAAKTPSKRGSKPAVVAETKPSATNTLPVEAAPAAPKAADKPAAPVAEPAPVGSSKSARGRSVETELPEGWERRYKEDGYTLEFTPHAKDEWPGYRIVVGGEVQGQVWREIQQPIRKPEGREPKIRFMCSYKGDDEVSVHRNMMGVKSRLGVKFGPNND